MAAGIVVWFTGYPASGKTTLAWRVRNQLKRPAIVLDSDDIRHVLEQESYSRSDRDHFYRTLGVLAAYLAKQGHAVLVAATAPKREHRDAARAQFPHFIEVWVRTPLETCESRDPKELYRRARSGALPELPGVGAAFEEPRAPELIVDPGGEDRAVAKIVAMLEHATAAPDA